MDLGGGWRVFVLLTVNSPPFLRNTQFLNKRRHGLCIRYAVVTVKQAKHFIAMDRGRNEPMPSTLHVSCGLSHAPVMLVQCITHSSTSWSSRHKYNVPVSFHGSLARIFLSQYGRGVHADVLTTVKMATKSVPVSSPFSKRERL